MLRELEREFDRSLDRYLDEWRELLAFPSVSTDPAYAGACRECAAWLTGHLAGMGFEAQLLPTPSLPVVWAQRAGDPSAPVVLLYGHYDVQPVDPLEEWRSPPFVPELRNGRMYARGAQDNKGQLFYALKAIQTLAERDLLRATVKILVEGEEECGSSGLAGSLSAWRDRLKAEVLMVTDTGTVAPGTGTIVMGLRGIIHLTAVLRGPQHDLHSGVHGGRAPNPAQGMAQLVTSLYTAEGRVAVKGFYDAVEPPTLRERELAARIPFDSAAYVASTGVPPVAGEPEFTPVERVGFRPSLDINGLHSGFGGPGSKTIIPAQALVKMTARLVPRQDPQSCLQAIIRHLQAHTPPGLRLEVVEQGVGGPALRLDPEVPLVAQARKVLEEITRREVVLLWEGASIPIVSRLAEVAGAQPLLIGFGCDEDRAHAPNESFSLSQFRQGYLYVASMLAHLQAQAHTAGSRRG